MASCYRRSLGTGYLCSVVFHGWADLQFRLSEGQSGLLDGVEALLILILVARCSTGQLTVGNLIRWRHCDGHPPRESFGLRLAANCRPLGRIVNLFSDPDSRIWPK